MRNSHDGPSIICERLQRGMTLSSFTMSSIPDEYMVNVTAV